MMPALNRLQMLSCLDGAYNNEGYAKIAMLVHLLLLLLLLLLLSFRSCSSTSSSLVCSKKHFLACFMLISFIIYSRS